MRGGDGREGVRGGDGREWVRGGDGFHAKVLRRVALKLLSKQTLLHRLRVGVVRV